MQSKRWCIQDYHNRKSWSWISKRKKVLVIDADPQGNLSQSLGIENPDELEIALPSIMEQIIMDKDVDVTKGIIHHEEGVDLMPCNIDLSGVDVSLVNAMSREFVLKTYVESMRDFYDYILIDCMPSLGMITVNSLTASDRVLVPVQAAYLPVKGLEQLITTIYRVKKHLNPQIQFEGILISMLNARTNYAKDIIELITEYYGESIPIFDSRIPFSVKYLIALIPSAMQGTLTTICGLSAASSSPSRIIPS